MEVSVVCRENISVSLAPIAPKRPSCGAPVARNAWYSAAVALLVCGGCATISSGSYGMQVDAAGKTLPTAAASPLSVSAGEIEDASSEYFGMIGLTFENSSPVWQQIDRIELDFGSPARNASVQIPWGADLGAWRDAVITRNAVRQANLQTALGALAVLGALGQRASGHSSVGRFGGLLEVGALGALYLHNAEQTAQAAQEASGPQFPVDHLLATPIRVPPGLFAKRWIVLYTAASPSGGCIDRVFLTYELADHTRTRVLLNYKTAPTEWMRQVCKPPPAYPTGSGVS